MALGAALKSSPSLAARAEDASARDPASRSATYERLDPREVAEELNLLSLQGKPAPSLKAAQCSERTCRPIPSSRARPFCCSSGALVRGLQGRGAIITQLRSEFAAKD